MDNKDFWNQILIEAEADLGVEEVPRGSNWGPKVQVYLAYVNIDKPAPWCAAAACTWIHRAAIKLGLSPTFKKSASAVGIWNNNPSLRVSKDVVPEPGWLFILEHDPVKMTGHVGVVKGIARDLATGDVYFDDVSGNSNNKGSREGFEVCTNMRNATNNSQLLGWIKPE